MSFLRFWIGFTLFGVAAGVALLVWSFRSRQFREPDRAACLPFGREDVPAPPVRWSRDAVVLVSVLGAGLVLLAVSVALALAW